MTKEELIESVAADAEVTKAAATKAVNSVFTNIKNALADGGDVNIIGFGKFSVVQKAAKIGRNPQTGAEIKIAAKAAPKFAAGKGLKDAVAKPAK